MTGGIKLFRYNWIVITTSKLWSPCDELPCIYRFNFSCHKFMYCLCSKNVGFFQIFKPASMKMNFPSADRCTQVYITFSRASVPCKQEFSTRQWNASGFFTSVILLLQFVFCPALKWQKTSYPTLNNILKDDCEAFSSHMYSSKEINKVCNKVSTIIWMALYFSIVTPNNCIKLLVAEKDITNVTLMSVEKLGFFKVLGTLAFSESSWVFSESPVPQPVQQWSQSLSCFPFIIYILVEIFLVVLHSLWQIKLQVGIGLCHLIPARSDSNSVCLLGHLSLLLPLVLSVFLCQS